MPAYAEASGKSCESPPAPCTWMALSRIHCTVCGVAILIAWISVCAPRLPTVSISQAVLSTSSRSCSMRTRDSAIQSRTTPWLASGRPKATRDAARRHISSIAASATPIARMQWWMRPGPKRAWAIANPAPSSPIRLETGTRTSVKRSSAWPPCSWSSYPKTVMPRTTSRPGVSRGHQDLALLAVPGRRRVGLAHHDHDLGVRVHRAGDPPLAAVEDVLVAVPLDPGLDVGRVGRGDVRLGHRERRADLGRQQRLEPALLLLGRAEEREHLHVAGVRRRAVEYGGREVPGVAGQLGERGVLQVGQPGAVGVLLGQEEVPEPELAGLGLELLEDRRLRPRPAVVELARAGRGRPARTARSGRP